MSDVGCVGGTCGSGHAPHTGRRFEQHECHVDITVDVIDHISSVMMARVKSRSRRGREGLPKPLTARAMSTLLAATPRALVPAMGYPNGGRPERCGRTFGYAHSQLQRTKIRRSVARQRPTCQHTCARNR